MEDGLGGHGDRVYPCLRERKLVPEYTWEGGVRVRCGRQPEVAKSDLRSSLSNQTIGRGGEDKRLRGHYRNEG